MQLFFTKKFDLTDHVKRLSMIFKQSILEAVQEIQTVDTLNTISQKRSNGFISLFGSLIVLHENKFLTVSFECNGLAWLPYILQC